MAQATTTRLLRSPLVELLVGPHGVDRYLELIRPDATVHDARARVLDVSRQTDRSVTLQLRPNAAWPGFRSGQFVRVGVELDGVRRTRTYSPASSEHAPDGRLELTITTHRNGQVSEHLRSRTKPGDVLHLGAPQGAFVLPGQLPDKLVLVSGGSGITPVISMLRTLCDQGHAGRVAFLHYARTEADWLYEHEVRALAARHSNVRVAYVATRAPAAGPEALEADARARVSAQALTELAGPIAGALIAVCGPPPLIDAVRRIGACAGESPPTVIAETFTPPTLAVTGAAAKGTLRFLHSGRSVGITPGTLLEQVEAAGLAPEYGCRMGICHTCVCRKAAGAVRNVLTGAVSAEEDEDIQLCISIPETDVALEL
jgi:stearoyl-CoA 9-desaturase NADPH oxidoreductase